jgi:hypothetical protein
MTEEQRKPTFIGGLDLGQSQDYTALAIVERLDPPMEELPKESLASVLYRGLHSPPPERPIKKSERKYIVRHLERFPAGTSYVDVCKRVVDVFSQPPLSGSNLAVDKTGVGAPVVDMLARSRPRCHLKPIMITAGHTVALDGPGWNVPKKDLVWVLQVLLQGRRLFVPRTLPNATLLLTELEMFRVKISAAAHETFEAWRERDHDDLVLAVALACWVGERGMKEFWAR